MKKNNGCITIYVDDNYLSFRTNLLMNIESKKDQSGDYIVHLEHSRIYGSGATKKIAEEMFYECLKVHLECLGFDGRRAFLKEIKKYGGKIGFNTYSIIVLTHD